MNIYIQYIYYVSYTAMGWFLSPNLMILDVFNHIPWMNGDIRDVSGIFTSWDPLHTYWMVKIN